MNEFAIEFCGNCGVIQDMFNKDRVFKKNANLSRFGKAQVTIAITLERS